MILPDPDAASELRQAKATDFTKVEVSDAHEGAAVEVEDANGGGGEEDDAEVEGEDGER